MSRRLQRLKRSAALCVVAALLATAATANAATLETEMVPMEDGTELATDIFKPDGQGPWPVLLFRTPYNKMSERAGKRDIADNNDVVVVVQDLRGRFASEGTDCVFRCDKSDGARTIGWIDEQPWSNGTVVSNGGSARGIVQYMHAAAGPEALDAMWVRVATPTVYDHGIYWNGVFRQSLMTLWLEAQGSSFFLEEVRDHPTRDGFWDSVQTEDDWGNVDVPAVHWGGWYDVFSQGTIDAYRGYQHQGAPGARGNQRLVMGPWVHGGADGGRQGDLQYPDNAFEGGPFAEDMYVRWLSHHLGIRDHSQWLEDLPTVFYYVMGAVGEPSAPGNEWRTDDQWPPASQPVRMYLQPGGGLAASCPPDDGSTTDYSYDPNDPSPTRGGNNLRIEAGPVDQRPVEQRDDVVVFETPTLEEPMEITGRVEAHLSASVDVAETDLMVRMTDVYPDGRSMLVLDAPARVNSPDGDVVEVTVDLWSTSIILAQGHKLRVSITSSNAPRFQPHPQPADVSIHHSLEHPSYLVLPDPSAEEGAVVQCDDDADSTDDVGSSGCSCSSAGGGPAPASLLVLLVGLIKVVLLHFSPERRSADIQ